MNTDPPMFRSHAVSPMQCMREGWQLIKDDYWLFLGITFFGIILGSLAPMALLMGPAMCGIYLCYLNRMEDRPVSFNILFRGFDYFLPSFVATLIMLVPTIFMLIGTYAVFGVAMFAMLALARGGPGEAPPDPAMPIAFFGLLGCFFAAVMLFSLLIGAFFMFTFPLIVDRRMSGYDAVRMSFRAVWANLGGVIGLIFLTQLLGFLGLLLCYVGAILEMPLGFAMLAVAYRQVFPREDPLAAFASDLDEPDEPLLVEPRPIGSTDIQGGEARPAGDSNVQAKNVGQGE